MRTNVERRDIPGVGESTITVNDREPLMMDVTRTALPVSIEIDRGGKVLWVNIDGVCRLRVCQAAGFRVMHGSKVVLDVKPGT